MNLAHPSVVVHASGNSITSCKTGLFFLKCKALLDQNTIADNAMALFSNHKEDDILVWSGNRIVINKHERHSVQAGFNTIRFADSDDPQLDPTDARHPLLVSRRSPNAIEGNSAQIGTRVMELIGAGRCTQRADSRKDAQFWWRCITCRWMWVCQTCGPRCHQGHEFVEWRDGIQWGSGKDDENILRLQKMLNIVPTNGIIPHFGAYNCQCNSFGRCCAQSQDINENMMRD
eukprot:TRINITY_DN4919_c0_g1_i1.p1 TRINITY_DN4919_c0_g1~~TRINITY_DN4919_c0_g1_i1.p1  ORF type:complete len:231 (+),score=8.35 TRINITY_DN4919_c0_g1_i1:306-998(+)